MVRRQPRKTLELRGLRNKARALSLSLLSPSGLWMTTSQGALQSLKAYRAARRCNRNTPWEVASLQAWSRRLRSMHCISNIATVTSQHLAVRNYRGSATTLISQKLLTSLTKVPASTAASYVMRKSTLKTLLTSKWEFKNERLTLSQ